MGASIKRLLLLLGISGMLLIIVGCRGDSLDNTGTEQAINARIYSFKTAVEAYDVERMLDFLEKNPTKDPLTIAEGRREYTKDYKTLEDELEQDEPNQIYWRKSLSEGGWGYSLTMKLGTITYDKLSASGAVARVPFAIIEASERLSFQEETDKGRMICTMVKRQGIWRCQHMIIHFNPDDSPPSPSLASYQAVSQANSKEGVKGFCFGELWKLFEDQ